MHPSFRTIALGSLAALGLAALPLDAQQDTPVGVPHNHVLSIQPLSAVFTVYAGELERVIGQSATLGIGATYWSDDDDGADASYLSSDLKLRYYPSGTPLAGFSFGVSVGFTRVESEDDAGVSTGEATGPTVGTMIEYGWLLNASRSFYIGMGLGAKALFIDEDEVDEDVTLRYPTARLSVGFAF